MCMKTSFFGNLKRWHQQRVFEGSDRQVEREWYRVFAEQDRQDAKRIRMKEKANPVLSV